jgi:hypothetical protein
MALVLDATVGGPDANSYVSVARASTLLEAELRTEPWFGPLEEAPLAKALREADQPAALCTATRLINEQVYWYGTPTTTTQALPVPMQGLIDRYGRLVASDSIPLALEQATALYALTLLREHQAAAQGGTTAQIKSKKMSDTTIVYQDSPTTPGTSALVRMPAEVRRLVTPYGTVAGGVMMPLYRV